MTRHADLAAATGIPVYFCAYCSWQRGSNENSNGLLRRYFPKKTDLSQHDADHLHAVVNELNSRPRQGLGWQTPHEVLGRHRCDDRLKPQPPGSVFSCR